MNENEADPPVERKEKGKKTEKKNVSPHPLRVSNKYLVAIFVFYFALVLLVVLSFYSAGIPMSTPVNAEIINGILTVAALIFGFSTFQVDLTHLWKPYRLILWLIFVTQAVLIAVAGLTYYRDFLIDRQATCRTLLASTLALVFSLASMILSKYVYESMQEPSFKEAIEEDKKLLEKEDVKP